MALLLPTTIILIIVVGLFCTYLIKLRNSLYIGALANLSLLVLLIFLVQLISLLDSQFWGLS